MSGGPLKAGVQSTQQPSNENVIRSVKFVHHGRTGKQVQTLRELRADAQHTLEDDARGVLIDSRILVPWSNILWVEYA